LNVKNSLKTQNNVDVSLGSLMRLWSLTLNPRYDFIKQERFSSYATGGYGLYNRRLLLAAPGIIPAVVCDPFWDVCVSNSPATNEMVTGNLSPYKGGYNVGGGVNFGTRTKFFVEVRYHRMFTDVATQVVPLTFGIRW
jgi:opacity protein-like surface antigen